jgi:hypothetical protein
MTKWLVKAKQGKRVVTSTVVTDEQKRAEDYTKYTLNQSSSQEVEILETTVKTKKRKKKKP